MGPPKMRFLDTYKREGTKKGSQIELTHFVLRFFPLWKLAGSSKKLKMEKGRLANDICHYRLVSSWSPNFTLKRYLPVDL